MLTAKWGIHEGYLKRGRAGALILREKGAPGGKVVQDTEWAGSQGNRGGLLQLPTLELPRTLVVVPWKESAETGA